MTVVIRLLIAVLLTGLLAGCAATADPSATSVPSSRPTFVGTKTEWMQAMVDCMQNKGVKARLAIDAEGAPTVEVDDPNDKGQDDAPGRVAWNECRDQLPVRPEPKTDADFKAMYDNLIVQTKCVQREGYETPPVPSWQSFVEDARVQDVDWDPTIRVPEQLRSTVRKACVDQDKWW